VRVWQIIDAPPMCAVRACDRAAAGAPASH
jgi:hypothetical protein